MGLTWGLESLSVSPGCAEVEGERRSWSWWSWERWASGASPLLSVWSVQELEELGELVVGGCTMACSGTEPPS